MITLLLLLPTNPLIWILLFAVFFLLFGASRIPKLARALGESKRALKDGLTECDTDKSAER